MPPPSAFRSHLLQQFVSRHPSSRTPPLALLGCLTDTDPRTIRSSATPQRTTDTSTVSLRNSRNPLTPPPPQVVSLLSHRRDFSTTTVEEDSTAATEFDPEPPPPASQLSLDFQTMIRTRRSADPFPLTPPEEDPAAAYYEYEMALVRAAQLGYAAFETEPSPFFFQRILTPQTKEQLAMIAANVYFTQELLEFKKIDQPDALEQLQAAARRKLERWRQIPAFLLTLVHTTSAAPSSTSNMEHPPMTEPAPTFPCLFDRDNVTYGDLASYRPAEPKCRFDDSAAAGAATQNALLALHADGFATHWVRGPLLHTPALAQLVRRPHGVRVVALVQVGRDSAAPRGREYFQQLHQRQQQEQRRRRKKWNELLEDL